MTAFVKMADQVPAMTMHLFGIIGSKPIPHNLITQSDRRERAHSSFPDYAHAGVKFKADGALQIRAV